MVARTASNARAAIRLLLGGYISESMSLIRGIEEVTNLMLLFMVSESDLEEFRAAVYRAREADFSPRKVLGKMRNLQGPDDQELRELADKSPVSYSEFSQAFTHFTRAWSPASYTISRKVEIVEPFVKTVTLTGLVMVANSVSAALIFAAERLILQTEEMADATVTNLELIRATRAYQEVSRVEMRLSSQGTAE